MQEGSLLHGGYPGNGRARRPCDAFVPGSRESLSTCKFLIRFLIHFRLHAGIHEMRYQERVIKAMRIENCCQLLRPDT